MKTRSKTLAGTRSPSGYTPGPWRQEGSIIRAGDFAIRLGVKVGKPQIEWDANARLIAAAPDLLESSSALMDALQAAYERDPEAFLEFFGPRHCRDFQAACAGVERAVAKAGGVDAWSL